MGINGESTVNITDDDVPSVTVRYEQASYTVGEGSSEVVKVILSADPERSVTVPISRTITFTATDDSVDDDLSR